MHLMSSSGQILGIGQVSISARDLERSTAFYRDVFGLDYLFKAQNMAFFDCGGVRLMLVQNEPDPSGQGTSIIYFRVDELEPTLNGIAARGGEILRGAQKTATLADHELWMAFVRDSEGNTMALMEERPLPD